MKGNIAIAWVLSAFLAISNPTLAEGQCNDEIDIKNINVSVLQQCAENNHGPSQLMYGLLHLQGDGVPVDGDKAVRWVLESLNDEGMGGVGYSMLGGVLLFGLDSPDALPTTIDRCQEVLGEGIASANFFVKSTISDILEIDEYGEGDPLLAKYGKTYEELVAFCKAQDLSY